MITLAELKKRVIKLNFIIIKSKKLNQNEFEVVLCGCFDKNKDKFILKGKLTDIECKLINKFNNINE